MDDASKILEAIGALGEQVGAVRTDIAGLKKTDEHLATEVHRIGEEQKRQGRELQELRAETLRTFESERHASQQTVAAITKHVDDSATAFREKAADIDALKLETAEQTAILKRLDTIAANPMVRRVFYLLGLAIAGWLASKGVK